MGELLELHARPGMPVASRRREPAISDRDEEHEWMLQQRMRNVVEMLLRVSNEVNAQNVCGIRININALHDFVNDELPVKLHADGRPTLEKWDSKISAVKNGD